MRETAPLEPLVSGKFCFDCQPGISCFTQCCAKLNLQLAPYDILRLSRRLEMKTGDFLDRYATAVEVPGRLPRVALMMNDDENERCPFVTDAGCSVYEDRPAACRTYPLARAASPNSSGPKAKEAWFVIREPHCKGFEESKEWTVEAWCSDQDTLLYYELNDLWLGILAGQKTVLESQGSEQKVKMFNLASYDLDQFRVFVLKGGLLDRLAIPERLVKKLETDDVQLFRFACSWLRLALFGEMASGLIRP